MKIAREELYKHSFDKQGTFFLAVDIGGTNSNFGVFSYVDPNPELILSVHYKSKEVTDFTELFKEVIKTIFERYGIRLTMCCIGAAGIVYPRKQVVKPTNLLPLLNLNDIKKGTTLEKIILINDFEAVAYGLEMIDPRSIITLHAGVGHVHGTIGFLGAGTGLGKSLLAWQHGLDRYLAVASEGGHADAAVQNQEEFDFIRFIQGVYATCPVSWETILSGAGIQYIYQWLGTKKNYEQTEISQEIVQHEFNPDRISKYAQVDQRCKDTFDVYVRFYARCAKNFALETLALNGIYIAGGIAAKNISLFFDPAFLAEFQNCGKHSKELENIPIHIIADYNISLYGAYVAYKLHERGLL